MIRTGTFYYIDECVGEPGTIKTGLWDNWDELARFLFDNGWQQQLGGARQANATVWKSDGKNHLTRIEVVKLEIGALKSGLYKQIA